ncbi:hypothetical protein DASC09_008720 [Saccharomycopsis crataegensis]|uniref:Uncharacterized protein n=1 Tax=Saccharomycopsis crataegensis TaxID=43959 RepID=A0AAV5QFY0_9ASCO|nr:hypothetical protein DASC09_008720 [Saccharomycopsis crataegensis]
MLFHRVAIVLTTIASKAYAVAAPEKQLFALAQNMNMPNSLLDSVFAIEKRDAASYNCHALCGNMISAAEGCSSGGSYDTDCYCSTGIFAENLSGCLSCGWCLWEYYSPYLEAPLGSCGEPTTPTGTLCAATSSSVSFEASSESISVTSSSETSSESSSTETSSETISVTSSSETSSESSSTETSSAEITNSAKNTSEDPTTVGEASSSSSDISSSSSSVSVSSFQGGAGMISSGAFLGGGIALAAGVIALI